MPFSGVLVAALLSSVPHAAQLARRKKNWGVSGGHGKKTNGKMYRSSCEICAKASSWARFAAWK
eukprot:1687014-Rhodomonas_salina.4